MKDGSIITAIFIVFIVAILSLFIYDNIIEKHNLERMIIKQQHVIETQHQAIRQMELLMMLEAEKKNNKSFFN